LQGSGNSISQTVDLAAGSYAIAFSTAQRPGNQQTFEVLVDNAVVATVTPSSSNFALYVTSSIALTAGSHTIEFVGLNPKGGDNTAFLGPISIYQPVSLLGPLQDNGGPTQTMALPPGSPAIAAGVPIAGVTADQRGLLRPATPSLGAFEANPVSIPAVFVADPGVPADPGGLQGLLYQGPGSPRNAALDLVITNPTAQDLTLYLFWGDETGMQIIPLGVGSGTFSFHATHRYSKKSFRQHHHKPYTVTAFVLCGSGASQTLLAGGVLVVHYSPQEVSSYLEG
jgi:hypothetical protein